MKTRNKVMMVTVLTAVIGGVAVTSLSIAHDRGNSWRSYWNHESGRDGHHGRKHGRYMHSESGEHFSHQGKRRDKWKNHHNRPHLEQLLQQFDSNDDGQLTQAEIEQVQTERLTAFDIDQDGQLNLDDYAAFWLDGKRSRMVDQFQNLDEDGNAIVTVEEFQAPFARLAKRLERHTKSEESQGKENN